MSPTYLALLNVLLPILLISSTVSAFNITAILENYPDFSGFNAILNQTGLAAEINRRTTLTVLAIDGGALGTISGQPTEIQKRILSVHVILDYYDTTKFQNLKKSSSSLVTLFQTTGKADQRQGFLNMTKINGEIFFGSAMPGSPLNAKFVKTVVAKPYNISVLQVSSVIVPPGISDLKPAPPSPPPPPAAVTAPAPAPSKSDRSAPAEAPAADAPAADAPGADAPGADAPAANAPAADAPAADTPSPAPNAPAADAPKPSKEEPAADEKKSDAGRVAVGAGFGVVIMMAGAALLGL